MKNLGARRRNSIDVDVGDNFLDVRGLQKLMEKGRGSLENCWLIGLSGGYEIFLGGTFKFGEVRTIGGDKVAGFHKPWSPGKGESDHGYAPAMSTDMSQVDFALFPSF